MVELNNDQREHPKPKRHNAKLCPLVIRVYDAAGDVIKTHEHAGDFKEP